jgi:hypothetical protein
MGDDLIPWPHGLKDFAEVLAPYRKDLIPAQKMANVWM